VLAAVEDDVLGQQEFHAGVTLLPLPPGRRIALQ
jgi:hypothetical protein